MICMLSVCHMLVSGNDQQPSPQSAADKENAKINKIMIQSVLQAPAAFIDIRFSYLSVCVCVCVCVTRKPQNIDRTIQLAVSAIQENTENNL